MTEPRIYHPSLLRDFLREIGAGPLSSLSQNFLIDGNVVEHVCDMLDANETDHILDLGAGPGCFTEHLTRLGLRVTSLDIDKKFAAALHRFHPAAVIHGDALQHPLDGYNKIVSNLPYHISGPLIARLLASPFERMVLMMQKEVADRLVAKPSTKAYGALTLQVELQATAELAFCVSKNSYYPKPKVDSAVVVLTPKPKAARCEELIQFVKIAFNQRRKTLAKAMSNAYPKQLIISALSDCNLLCTARAEELTLAQFTALFEKIAPQPQ